MTSAVRCAARLGLRRDAELSGLLRDAGAGEGRGTIDGESFRRSLGKESGDGVTVTILERLSR
jgi:hypothetical protein